MQLLLAIVLPFAAVVSFLCAGMEAGVFALSRWRIKQLTRRKAKRALLLYRFLDQSENFLWTILVGNTLAAITAMCIIAMALQTSLLGKPGWQILTFALAIFLFYAFCDLLPKMLFRQYPNRLCLLAATPFRLIHLALAPLVALVETFANSLLRWTGGKAYTGHVFGTRSELRLFMQDTGESLSSEEKAMINRVLDLPAIRVRQIAIPFNQLPEISASEAMSDVFTRFRDLPHNALPVWTGEGKNRRVAGILNLKSVLFNPRVRPAEPVSAYLSSVLYLDEDTHLEQALRRMQKSGQRIAIVLGRNRQELGVVTLENILRVIFGEVQL